MKLSKSDITLNEQDTLQDLLDGEKQLMSLYTTALFEGSTKSVRKKFIDHLAAVANDQYCLFLELSDRGYYQVKPALKTAIDEANDKFKKQKSALKADN
jgi:spore coat protein CotF